MYDIYGRKMSTSPYSKDLREKVINYLKTGAKQKITAKIFGLHHNTVNRWWSRYKKEGNFLARTRPGALRKLNVDSLAKFIDQNSNCKLLDIAKKFNITEAWASVMLKKLGYSYKKNRLPTWKQAKANAQSTVN